MLLPASGDRIHTEIVFYGPAENTINAANPRNRAVIGLSLFGSQEHTLPMIPIAQTVLLLGVILVSWTDFLATKTESGSKIEYTIDAQLKFPEHYREWVYLTSGFDMSYNPAGMEMGHHMFDNVFVNPEAYRVFVATGTWPDKTMLVLEGRRAEGKGSINQKGNYQSGETMGVEVHVKDESRFPGKWAFFGFGEAKTAKMIATTADCYSCHASHAAADTTFVQFYPTLLPIAKSKATLSPAYVKEAETPAQK
jgi:Cytochrome P460